MDDYSRLLNYDPGQVSSYIPQSFPGRANDLSLEYMEAGPLGTAFAVGAGAPLAALAGTAFRPGSVNIIKDWVSGIRGAAATTPRKELFKSLLSIMEGATARKQILEKFPEAGESPTFRPVRWRGELINPETEGHYADSIPEIMLTPTKDNPRQLISNVGHEMGHRTSMTHPEIDYVLDYIGRLKSGIDERIERDVERFTRQRIVTHTLDWLKDPLEMVARNLESKWINDIGLRPADIAQLNKGFPWNVKYWDWYYGQSFPHMVNKQYNTAIEDMYQRMIGK